MKLTYKIGMWAVSALSVLSMASCSDDFFEPELNGSYVTTEQMAEASKQNTQILLGQVQGITTNLLRWQSGGTTRQDDFGQKSIDIVTDLMSRDMVFSRGNSYGWFSDAATLRSTIYTGDRAYMLWRYYYRVIDSSNAVFAAAGSDVEEPEEALGKLYFATAKTIRAYAYMGLLTNYSRNYDVAKDKKTFPVYCAPSSNYSAPQTVDSVYNLVEKDLKGAIAAYEHAAEEGVGPDDISMPDIDVAYTLLAYAKLQKGENAEALAAAKKAIEISAAQPLTSNQLFFGFNTVRNNNWMWGVDITDDNTGGLCTFWGMMDYFTYGYTPIGDFKVINSDLYQQIPETDARADWFPQSYALLPVNKFYDPARQPMGDATWTNDIHFMRIEEAYMIAAESAARMGDTQTAAQYLGTILDERDPETSATLADMTKEELLDQIYFNWRLEFWGEGKSLMTKKRFQKNILCPANDYYKALTQNGPLSYDDDRFIFAIPQNELNANPLLKDAEQ